MVFKSIFNSTCQSCNYFFQFNKHYELCDVSMLSHDDVSNYMSQIVQIGGRKDLHIGLIFKSRELVSIIQELVTEMMNVGMAVYEIPQPNMAIFLSSAEQKFEGFVLLLKNDTYIQMKQTNPLQAYHFAIQPITRQYSQSEAFGVELMRNDSFNIRPELLAEIKKDHELEMYGSSDGSSVKQTLNLMESHKNKLHSPQINKGGDNVFDYASIEDAKAMSPRRKANMRIANAISHQASLNIEASSKKNLNLQPSKLRPPRTPRQNYMTIDQSYFSRERLDNLEESLSHSIAKEYVNMPTTRNINSAGNDKAISTIANLDIKQADQQIQQMLEACEKSKLT